VNAGCGGCQGRFGTTTRTLCVSGPADLAKLLRSRPKFDSIRIVAALPLDERSRWERRLFSLYDECGCQAGAVALLMTLVAVGIRSWLQPAPLGWRAIAVVVLLCFAAVAAGKISGMAIAKWKLRAEVRDLGEALERTRSG
jgi:hypothetical protein